MRYENIETIETERTIGRRVIHDDLGLLYRMYTNEEVMYTLGGTRTFLESKEFMNKMTSHWEEFGYGVYIFFDKATNDFLGRCGFKKNTIENKEEIELLYALMPTYWGKGYTAEISKRLLQVAFDDLKISDIVCLTSAANKPSQRVMEKAGFKLEKNLTYQNEASVLYRIRNI